MSTGDTDPTLANNSAGRNILIIGATGVQGRSLISAALNSASATADDIHILALTRSASSPSSQHLVKAHASAGERITLVEADLDRPETLRKVFEDAKAKGGIWGVFVVLAFPGLGADATGEEKQGKLVADLAHEFGVQHFIYSSAERGGEEFDDQSKLSRLAKVNIEKHVKSLEGLRWTILRPAFFMENFQGTIGRITASVIRVGLKPTTKLQLIAGDDIGYVALAVFQSPEVYAGKAITVIGDALTTAEIAASYKRGAGSNMPSVPSVFGWSLLAMNKHTKDLISDIERTNMTREALPEKAVDLIRECRALYPGMRTMEAWAADQAKRREDPQQHTGWNNVSIVRLLTGKM